MLKHLILWPLGLFVLLQFIQIKIPEPPTTIDPTKEIQEPKELVDMFKRSCYDCHSYETKMPWYGSIAPFSFEVKSHIKAGRSALNFQEWENYDEAKKQKIYKGIARTINIQMPLPMYLMVHEDAKLNKNERDQIKAWAKSHIVEEDR